MNYSSAIAHIKTIPFLILLLFSFSLNTANAQNYWDNLPALTSQCYSDNDDFGKKVQQLRTDIKDRLEKSKKAVEEKASKMTPEERMAMATRYQNMKPEEIIKMQNEMMEMTQAQTEFQQLASAFENRFIELESEFRSEFGRVLGPIEQEYQKLPDGEGTPQWAIKKGDELMVSYNKEYEGICNKYLTSSDSKFRHLLNDYNAFLVKYEIPFNQKMLKSQYSQFGITPDESVASLMAVDKYLEKCVSIFGLRRQYPQG